MNIIISRKHPKERIEILITVGGGFLKVHRDIRSSCEQLWSLITDTTQWPLWGPSVTGVKCRDRYIRAGSEGEVKTVAGLWMTFRITAYEEKKYWSWRVSGIPATGHRVEPLGLDLCRLVFEVPLLASAYAPVCVLALKRIADILEG